MRMACFSLPGGQLFQVYGSKFKLHPVGNLGQASVLRIAHTVFLLGIRKDTLDFLFSHLAFCVHKDQVGQSLEL